MTLISKKILYNGTLSILPTKTCTQQELIHLLFLFANLLQFFLLFILISFFEILNSEIPNSKTLQFLKEKRQNTCMSKISEFKTM